MGRVAEARSQGEMVDGANIILRTTIQMMIVTLTIEELAEEKGGAHLEEI